MIYQQVRRDSIVDHHPSPVQAYTEINLQDQEYSHAKLFSLCTISHIVLQMLNKPWFAASCSLLMHATKRFALSVKTMGWDLDIYYKSTIDVKVLYEGIVWKLILYKVWPGLPKTEEVEKVPLLCQATRPQ